MVDEIPVEIRTKRLLIVDDAGYPRLEMSAGKDGRAVLTIANGQALDAIFPVK